MQDIFTFVVREFVSVFIHNTTRIRWDQRQVWWSFLHLLCFVLLSMSCRHFRISSTMTYSEFFQPHVRKPQFYRTRLFQTSAMTRVHQIQFSLKMKMIILLHKHSQTFLSLITRYFKLLSERARKFIWFPHFFSLPRLGADLSGLSKFVQLIHRLWTLFCFKISTFGSQTVSTFYQSPSIRSTEH